MKYIVLFLVVLFFMGMPVYLLNTLVMPELTSLQQVYGQADVRAEQLVVAR